jgi:predicted transcriptional regulator
VVRETRLSLAEELSSDIKGNLLNFVKSIDELDAAINSLGLKKENEEQEKLFQAVSEKSKKVRKHVAELDARIEKTIAEWDKLKKNEIVLSMLESQIRNNLNEG